MTVGTGRWVQERLGVTLRTADAPVGVQLEDLVGLAVRRNPRRAHLLVSTVLGKHVPTDPRIVRGAGLLLGDLVHAALVEPAPGDGLDDEVRARGAVLRSAVHGEADDAALERLTAARGRPAADVTVLGYAETATALGAQVAEALGAPYLHSTRRHVPGVAVAGRFEEAHSHATSHLLLPADPDLLTGDEPLVLVDDELSTGRTALATIEALHAVHPRARYVVAALIDLRSPDDRARTLAAAERWGTRIDVVALAAGGVDLPPGLPERAAELVASLGAPDAPPQGAGEPDAPGRGAAAHVVRVRVPWPADLPESARHGWDPAWDARRDAAVEHVAAAVERALEEAPGDVDHVIVLGTEELLDVPQRIGAVLARTRTVRSSSTTRSPVLAVDDPGYAVRSAVRFVAHDDPADAAEGDTTRHAYNVAGAGADAVVLVLDEKGDTEAATVLVDALAAVTPVVVVATLPDTAARTARGRALPEPLHGPAFGSYPADEVTWLLTDLSHVALEAPVEEREEAVQSGGAHYAESLPVEYLPSAAYTALFDEALADSARRMALAVGVVTERALAARTEPVLVSLARAGTPVGALMRRWAARVHGVDVPHYTASIVRGRGIDHLALQHVAAHHDPRGVLFVDGWTGKGAIARELAAALVEHEAITGVAFPSELAVLADPGWCVDLFGTRDDFLIPSACLNSTVSGLVSRTVLNPRILREDQFHGAKFYAELAPSDVSLRFLDAVSAWFDDVAQEAQALARVPVTDAPDWRGWAAVVRVAQEQGIGDVNLVKPGIGETTRVLLRRVPWKILVREDADPRDLRHIRQLAHERGVPVEPAPDLPYACIGLIHPQYTRGATGASGTGVQVAP